MQCDVHFNLCFYFRDVQVGKNQGWFQMSQYL